jgi:hypothetical protein
VQGVGDPTAAAAHAGSLVRRAPFLHTPSPLSHTPLTPPPPQATARLRKNAAYFRTNYLIVLLSSIAVGFLMHPSSLFMLGGLVVGWIYVFALRTGPLVINGRELRCDGAGGVGAGTLRPEMAGSRRVCGRRGLQQPSSRGGGCAGLLLLLAAMTANMQLNQPTPTPTHTISPPSPSEREKVMSMSGLSFVVIFFLTNVASVVFSALTFGAALVAAHGATRVPDDLFIDDSEVGGGVTGVG